MGRGGEKKTGIPSDTYFISSKIYFVWIKRLIVGSEGKMGKGGQKV